MAHLDHGKECLHGFVVDCFGEAPNCKTCKRDGVKLQEGDVSRLANHPDAQFVWGEPDRIVPKFTDCQGEARVSSAPSAGMKAAAIAERAASLVGGDRAHTHGDKLVNFQNVAALWQSYLYRKEECHHTGSAWNITALDAANMLELFKIARRLTGAHNIDDYVDGAGYAAVAGEIAELSQ